MSECRLRLCAHRAADGTSCKAPAVRQSDYCRHHVRVHRPAVTFPAYVYEAHTAPELDAAIQRTSQNLWDGTYTQKYAGQVLYEISKRMRLLGKPAGIAK